MLRRPAALYAPACCAVCLCISHLFCLQTPPLSLLFLFACIGFEHGSHRSGHLLGECCSCLLIGVGDEWAAGEKRSREELAEAYQALYSLTEGKDYFIITTVTDGLIRESAPDQGRITAPCGNEQWQQCSRACTRDIWEPGEIPDGLCPHCGAPLTGNTIFAETYIEEGYLPQWKAYQEWLGRTLNRELLAVELGEGFLLPKLIRWPFEKTVFFNKKAHMYRVNETFAQVSEDIGDRSVSVQANSVDFVRMAAACLKN